MLRDRSPVRPKDNGTKGVRDGVKTRQPRLFVSVALSLGLSVVAAEAARAATINAASCNASDVQGAINSASEGDTVTIPAGTCTWTSGVTISGKGIIVKGAGSGRIIAYDDGVEKLTVGTGILTVNVAGFSPGFSGASFTVGETLRVFENNARINWMQGTVTSYSGKSLVMNITSTGGSGATHRWLISTVPSTILVNNSGSTLFSVTEDSSFHTNLSGFKIAQGTGVGDGVDFISGGAQAILLHDCWIEQPGANPQGGGSVRTGVSRGVVWNCSFDASPFSMAPLAFDLVPYDQTAWSMPSYWGALDTNGERNFYVENCDFHAYLNATNNDEGARSVFRYNLFDNAGFGTHGADSSPMGQRYFEYYNNTGVFNGYSDGTTFNMNWWFFVRGGTYVIHDNTLPAFQSQDYGTKADVNMTVMNLQRNAGPNPCWGQGTSGGADYYAPQQVGMGYVTGTGVDGKGQSTYIPGNGYSTPQYVGDSEPAYIWGNSRVPLGNVVTSDYGSGNADSCTGTVDTSANYIKLNRDYFNGSTPKPGYTPYTYPHPLRNAGGGGGGYSACDLNQDNSTNVIDVQLEVNMALGVTSCTGDINKDGVCNIVDVQRVVNAALGGQCVTSP